MTIKDTAKHVRKLDRLEEQAKREGKWYRYCDGCKTWKPVKQIWRLKLCPMCLQELLSCAPVAGMQREAG